MGDDAPVVEVPILVPHQCVEADHPDKIAQDTLKLLRENRPYRGTVHLERENFLLDAIFCNSINERLVCQVPTENLSRVVQDFIRAEEIPAQKS
jgi:hypothetical protein